MLLRYEKDDKKTWRRRTRPEGPTGRFWTYEHIAEMAPDLGAGRALLRAGYGADGSLCASLLACPGGSAGEGEGAPADAAGGATSVSVFLT